MRWFVTNGQTDIYSRSIYAGLRRASCGNKQHASVSHETQTAVAL